MQCRREPESPVKKRKANRLEGKVSDSVNRTGLASGHRSLRVHSSSAYCELRRDISATTGYKSPTPGRLHFAVPKGIRLFGAVVVLGFHSVNGVARPRRWPKKKKKMGRRGIKGGAWGWKRKGKASLSLVHDHFISRAIIVLWWYVGNFIFKIGFRFSAPWIPPPPSCYQHFSSN